MQRKIKWWEDWSYEDTGYQTYRSNGKITIRLPHSRTQKTFTWIYPKYMGKQKDEFLTLIKCLFVELEEQKLTK